MRALILGGGVGGLTAALCLRRIGWDVQVFERASQISEFGAGVQISPNGAGILEALGVMPLLAQQMFMPATIQIRRLDTGKAVMSLPIKPTERARAATTCCGSTPRSRRALRSGAPWRLDSFWPSLPKIRGT